jgi:hypothetical protein
MFDMWNTNWFRLCELVQWCRDDVVAALHGRPPAPHATVTASDTSPQTRATDRETHRCEESTLRGWDLW